MSTAALLPVSTDPLEYETQADVCVCDLFFQQLFLFLCSTEVFSGYARCIQLLALTCDTFKKNANKLIGIHNTDSHAFGAGFEYRTFSGLCT